MACHDQVIKQRMESYPSTPDSRTLYLGAANHQLVQMSQASNTYLASGLDRISDKAVGSIPGSLY